MSTNKSGYGYYYDKHDWVRFRVESEQWHDLSPVAPAEREAVALGERKSPYSITVRLGASIICPFVHKEVETNVIVQGFYDGPRPGPCSVVVNQKGNLRPINDKVVHELNRTSKISRPVPASALSHTTSASPPIFSRILRNSSTPPPTPKYILFAATSPSAEFLALLAARKTWSSVSVKGTIVAGAYMVSLANTSVTARSCSFEEYPGSSWVKWAPQDPDMRWIRQSWLFMSCTNWSHKSFVISKSPLVSRGTTLRQALQFRSRFGTVERPITEEL